MFKQGMISGGQHTNIFNVNLGQFTLDREIKKLVEETQQLEKRLQTLKSEHKEEEMGRLMRDMARTEMEEETLRMKMGEQERVIRVREEHKVDGDRISQSLQAHIEEMQAQLADTLRVKAELQADLQEAEDVAFREFLGQRGMKSVAEYEQSQTNEKVRDLNERKNTLMQTVAKCEAEIHFILNSNQKHALTTLENILKQEEDKL